MTKTKLLAMVATGIRHSRARLKFTMSRLAEASDLDTAYLAHIETQRKSPSLDALARILNGLQITPEELFRAGRSKETDAADPLDLVTGQEQYADRDRTGIIKIAMPPPSPLTLILTAVNGQVKQDRPAVASAVQEIIGRAPAVAWVPIAEKCVELAGWAWRPGIIEAPEHAEYAPLAKKAKAFRDGCRAAFDLAVDERVQQLRTQQAKGNALRALARLCVAREQFESRHKMKVTFLIHGGTIIDHVQAGLEL